LKTGQVAATSGTLAQCLNLEHEVHHTASKLRILGFEPLRGRSQCDELPPHCLFRNTRQKRAFL
jgi:hypothetical protein